MDHQKKKKNKKERDKCKTGIDSTYSIEIDREVLTISRIVKNLRRGQKIIYYLRIQFI